MGRCLNCIHFDVCDSDRHEKERLYGDCSDFLNDADVVPKSEVEKTIAEFAHLHADALNKFENARAEVAREICCEIEEEIVAALERNYKALESYDDGRCNKDILELVNRFKGKIDALRDIEYFVKEIKKKYTEDRE